MRCSDQETLTIFADGEIAGMEREMIEQHLAGCEACRDLVNEMRALNSISRTALRSLRVSPPRIVLARRRRLLQPLAFAAAAMIALIVLLAAVVVMSWRDGDAVKVAATPPLPAPATAAHSAREVPPLLDEAFERWAAEHRRKQIPLIPMEEVATFEPPQRLPFHPARGSNL